MEEHLLTKTDGPDDGFDGRQKQTYGRKPMRELILGCGDRKHGKIIAPTGTHRYENPTTLDNNADHHPDVFHDLENIPLPFADNTYDEIHAYDVLEHTGAQGDHEFFFAQFTDLWRILVPSGLLCATVPHWRSLWAFGDPSHKRIINAGTLAFLCQKSYENQVGVTPMSDFRYLYKADFNIAYTHETDEHFLFALEAVK